MVRRKPLSDLVGKSFNRLTVSEYLGIRKHGKHWWRCKCVCGVEVELNTSRITGSTPTKSCGCLRRETCALNRANPLKHGYTITHPHLYAIYHGMLQRCYNPKCQRYKYYGGRGIQVCKSWMNNPELFFRWALLVGYEDGLSIDRRNPDNWYNPYNCEWVTRSENSRRMNEFKRNAKATP